MGLFQQWLIKLFGVNYKTSFYGTVFVLSGLGTYLTSRPEIMSGLPKWLSDWIFGICGLATTVAGILTFINTKDKAVSGTNGSAKRLEDGKLQTKTELTDNTLQEKNQLKKD